MNDDTIIGVLIFIIIIIMLYGMFKFEQYKFNDCKKVGHATTYCILKLGK